MQALEEVLQQAEAEIRSSADLKSLDQYRVHYLGKKGLLTEYLKTLGQLPPEERPAAGQKVNIVKSNIQALIEQQDTQFKQSLIEKQLAADSLDITLPGRSQRAGSIHPIVKTFEDLKKIFSRM